MKFTNSQLLARLARRVWSPFRRLVNPKKSPKKLGRNGPWLADWRRISWMPVYESVHPTAQRLILAAMRNEMLSLRYWGGSTPGQRRHISPGVVFQLGGRGPLYVAGYCHLRRAERVFRVDCVEMATEEDTIIHITE